MKELSFDHGQTVYAESDLAKFVYIVTDGEFELTRFFQKEKRKDFIIKILEEHGGKPRMVSNNTLEKRLTEVNYIPDYHRLSIFQKGSLVAEEDVLNKEKYSYTLKCYSTKGKLY